MTATRQPIPGTTIFDGDQAQKGYALNKMCMSFHVPISNTAAGMMLLEPAAR